MLSRALLLTVACCRARKTSPGQACSLGLLGIKEPSTLNVSTTKSPPDSVHQVILDYVCGFDDGAPSCLHVSCL